jgi:phage gpG-like protein
MALRGDFGKLAKVISTVDKVAGGKLTDRARRAAGEAALTELRRGFRNSRDPYGKPWAELVLRDGKPLRDTGRLANSFSLRLTPNGFTIGTPIEFAYVHQFGATIVPVRAKALRFKPRGSKRFVTLQKAVIPARKMLPEGDDLGTWREPIADALGEAWAMLWKEGGLT